MGLRNRNQLKHKRCFFVTTTCNQWLHIFDSNPYYDLLGSSLNFVAKKYDAAILGYVIMREAAPPNHLHFIVVFNGEENRLSELMRDFNGLANQKFTSTHIRRLIQEAGNHGLLSKLTHEVKRQKYKIWMDGFDDVWLGKREVVETKLKYIHNNPLQPHRALADNPTNYPYSSAGFYYFEQKNIVQLTHYLEYF